MLREIACLEFIAKLPAIIAMQRDFSAIPDLGADLQGSLNKFNLIKAKIEGIKERIDRDHLFTRSEVAKWFQFDFVSELYPDPKGGFVAWGAYNYGQRNKAQFYLVKIKYGSEFRRSDADYPAVSPFIDGSAAVADNDMQGNEVFYLINTSGARISQPYHRSNFDGPFMDRGEITCLYNSPLSLRYLDSTRNSYSGRFLKSDGHEFQVDADDTFASDKPSEGLLWAKRGGKQMALDKAGQCVFELPQYFEMLYRFDNGVALGFTLRAFATRSQTCFEVWKITKDGKCEKIPGALVDDIRSEGKNPNCDWQAGDGYYRAAFGGQRFFFNKEGEKIYPRDVPEDGYVFNFDSGYALVRKKAKRGEDQEAFYIDKTGNPVTGKFEEAGSFRDGFAVVKKRGVNYLLNKKLEIIPLRTEIPIGRTMELYGGCLKVELIDGSTTFLDMKGRQMMSKIKCEYAGAFEHGVCEVKTKDANGNKMSYFIDKRGKRIFEGPK